MDDLRRGELDRQLSDAARLRDSVSVVTGPSLAGPPASAFTWRLWLRRHIRSACVVALLAGVALGSVRRDEPPRPALTWNGYTVLAGDFHVHGSPDGIPPWDAVREARRRRLDVVALTSHNSMSGWWLWTHAPWRPDNDVIVLPGEELTSVGYHMAIVGLSQTIPWRQTARAAAAAAHAQQAVAILAHPSGTAFKRLITDEDLRAVDGIEVAHPGKETSDDARQDFLDVYNRATAMKPKMAAIGSSDFHYFAPIGVGRTYLFVRDATPDGVLEAIRSARTVSCDARGRTTGPAVLAAPVDARCSEDARALDGDTPAARAGTALAWAALAALVILGAGDSHLTLTQR
jgi:hypothetical protein